MIFGFMMIDDYGFLDLCNTKVVILLFCFIISGCSTLEKCDYNNHDIKNTCNTFKVNLITWEF